MLIDTHCHLNFEAFEKDLDEVVQRAKKEGVEKIIIPGAKIDSSKKAVELAQKYDDCYAAVGIHPHHASKNQEIKNLLLTLAKQNKVVAIGECGLDYYAYQRTVYDQYKITPEIKNQQKELLKIHLEVAIDLGLPVILHCREAFMDMLPIVPRCPGVFHCFSGTKDDLKQILEMGFYVGFDGNITFKNAKSLQELVKQTPLDRILSETDAPYLTPEPHRGERNEPKNVKIVASKIAQIKGISLEEVEKQITYNAQSLFNI